VTAADQPELMNAAAAAVEAGMATAQQYWQSAASNPGVGAEVRLPSVPDALGRKPIGLCFEVAPDPAPAPGRPAIKLVPSYASDIVGGSLHQDAVPVARNDAAWPPGTTVTVLPGAPSWCSRLQHPSRRAGPSVLLLSYVECSAADTQDAHGSHGKGSNSSAPQPSHARSVAGVTPSQCWQKMTRWRSVVISHSAAK
jgi:hypothetical protein